MSDGVKIKYMLVYDIATWLDHLQTSMTYHFKADYPQVLTLIIIWLNESSYDVQIGLEEEKHICVAKPGIQH